MISLPFVCLDEIRIVERSDGSDERNIYKEMCLWEKRYYAYGIQKLSNISSFEIDEINIIRHLDAWFAYGITGHLCWGQCKRSRFIY